MGVAKFSFSAAMASKRIQARTFVSAKLLWHDGHPHHNKGMDAER